MHAPPQRSGRLAGPLVAAATWSLIGLAGCSNNGTSTDMGPGNDMGMSQVPGPPSKATSVATVDRPLAAVLTPDGKTVYFTAHDANKLAQLYSVPAAGGTPAAVTTSAPLIHPLGLAISPDGGTLFIVDDAGGPEDAGAVYISSTSGALGGNAFTGIRGPAGIALSPDGKTAYITGFEAVANGQPGLFTASATGGAVTAVAKGAPFSSPSGVTVTADGTVYVVDGGAKGPKLGGVLKVAGSTATVITTQPLVVGFPAGISADGVGTNDLLVTANSGLGAGVIYNVTTAGAATQVAFGTTLFDPATIHQAAKVSAWVTVDSVNATQPAAGQQQGSIYVLTP